MFSFVNDEYLKEASISVFDIGLSRGFGAFDFLRTYLGKPFQLKAHLRRLRHSAKKLGLCVHKTDEEIEKIVIKLMELNQLTEANVKFLVTGGKSSDHLMPGNQPSLIVMAYPLLRPPKEWYEQGVSVTTFMAERFLPDCKSLNYTLAIVALQQAKKVGAIEALYVNRQQHVLEGTTSNFFLFSQGVLVTPEEEILAGITRHVVLDLAKDLFPVERRKISLSELLTCEEAFITASNKEIVPVVKIDQNRVGSGLLGENTKIIMETFRSYTKANAWHDIDWQ
ncbi:MAG: aminotransferase class IV [Chlamydiota bacterium]